jgi:hypothetical protein
VKALEVLALVEQATAEPDPERDCLCCHTTMSIDAEAEPSPLCHRCAYAALDALVEWAGQLLDRGTPGHRYRVNRHKKTIIVSEHHSKMDGSHVKLELPELHARRLLTELIYALDKETT